MVATNRYSQWNRKYQIEKTIVEGTKTTGKKQDGTQGEQRRNQQFKSILINFDLLSVNDSIGYQVISYGTV